MECLKLTAIVLSLKWGKAFTWEQLYWVTVHWTPFIRILIDWNAWFMFVKYNMQGVMWRLFRIGYWQANPICIWRCLSSIYGIRLEDMTCFLLYRIWQIRFDCRRSKCKGFLWTRLRSAIIPADFPIKAWSSGLLTHCGRGRQICVFNTVKLGTSASFS